MHIYCTQLSITFQSFVSRFAFVVGSAKFRNSVRSMKPTSICLAVPYLGRLDGGFPPRRPRFKPRPSRMGSVVDKATPGEGFLRVFGFPCKSFIPPISPQSSSINRRTNGLSISGSFHSSQMNKKGPTRCSN
jgi:hypothetical protein